MALKAEKADFICGRCPGDTLPGVWACLISTHTGKAWVFRDCFLLGPRAQPFPKIGKSLLLYHVPLASVGGFIVDEGKPNSVGMIATLKQSLLTSQYEDSPVYLVPAF